MANTVLSSLPGRDTGSVEQTTVSSIHGFSGAATEALAPGSTAEGTGQLPYVIDSDGNRFYTSHMKNKVGENFNATTRFRRMLVTQRWTIFCDVNWAMKVDDVIAALESQAEVTHVAPELFMKSMMLFKLYDNPRDGVNQFVVVKKKELFTLFLNSQYGGKDYTGSSGVSLRHFLTEDQANLLLAKVKRVDDPLVDSSAWISAAEFTTMFQNWGRAVNCVFGVETSKMIAECMNKLQNEDKKPPGPWAEVWCSLVENALWHFSSAMFRATGFAQPMKVPEEPVVERVSRLSQTPQGLIRGIQDTIFNLSDVYGATQPFTRSQAEFFLRGTTWVKRPTSESSSQAKNARRDQGRERDRRREESDKDRPRSEGDRERRYGDREGGRDRRDRDRFPRREGGRRDETPRKEHRTAGAACCLFNALALLKVEKATGGVFHDCKRGSSCSRGEHFGDVEALKIKKEIVIATAEDDADGILKRNDGAKAALLEAKRRLG